MNPSQRPIEGHPKAEELAKKYGGKKDRGGRITFPDWLAQSLLSAFLRWLGRLLLVVWGILRRTVVFGLLLRYWWLFVIFGAAVALCFSKALFNLFGTMIYIPALTVGAELTALLIRNIVNRDTTDKDADNGTLAQGYFAMTTSERYRWAQIQHLVRFLGAALIASQLARFPY